MSKDRDKALDMALAQIDKQFGSGAIMKMGERTNMESETVRPVPRRIRGLRDCPRPSKAGRMAHCL